MSKGMTKAANDLMAENIALRKQVATEHEIALTWHRQNMELATRNMELSKALNEAVSALEELRGDIKKEEPKLKRWLKAKGLYWIFRCDNSLARIKSLASGKGA